MKIQDDDRSCGIFAVMNAIRCFDRKASKKIITKHTRTDKDGTDEEGISRAISRLGYTPRAERHRKFPWMWEHLTGCLAIGNPCILSIDGGTHWVVAIGSLGNSVIVIDSENSKKNRKENGIRLFSKKKLSKAWKDSDGFYLIEVIKK